MKNCKILVSSDNVKESCKYINKNESINKFRLAKWKNSSFIMKEEKKERKRD